MYIWSKEPDYLFCEQDEDLILAQYVNNIDLYLEFIDNESVSIEKRNTLIEALCVMIYEGVKKSENENQNITKQIASELKKREQLVFRGHLI